MIEIKTYAPVLITTLNRYEHFKRCVESLSRCTHAEKTELVIGLDYPPNEKYVAGWEKISEYVKSISGFGKITIFKREENLGSSLNSRELRKYARLHYDRYICVEDDVELSPNFLDYINKGLEKYKDDPKVFAICGYNYFEIDMTGYEKEYYFSHEVNAWGWGRWFNEKCDGLMKATHKPGYLTGLVKDVPFWTFLKNNTKRCNLLFNIGLEFRGDAYYTYYEWNYDMYCMFPTLSMIRNYGYDGTGIHCDNQDGRDAHSTQPIDNRLTFDAELDLPVQFEKDIARRIRSFQTGTFREKVKRVILLVLMKCFVKLRGY